MCPISLDTYLFFKHIITGLIFLIVLFWPYLSMKYHCLCKFFIEFDANPKQPHKILFVLTSTTILVGSYVFAFSWLINTSFKVLYYFILTILSTLTKFQYEKLFSKIVYFQQQNKYKEVNNDDFLNDFLKNDSDTKKTEILNSIRDVVKEL